MNLRFRSVLALLLLVAAARLPAVAAAQQSDAAAPVERVAPQDPEPPLGPVDQFDYDGPRPSPVLRVGADFTLNAADEAREVVIVSGRSQIAGHVHGDLVVIFGDCRIADTATIDGSVTVIGGTVSVAAGARVEQAFVAIGADVTEAPGFTPGQEHVVVDPGAVGIDIGALGAWVAQGLLMGRPIAPTVTWVWIVVGAFFLVYVMILLSAERPVRRCAQTLNARPLTAFLTGLLVLLLASPIALLLIVSVAGLVVLPFACCGLIAAWVVGKVGVLRWIGARAIPESLDPELPASRAAAVRSLLIGAVALTLAYMVPVVGMLAWGTTGVLALGAAVLTIFEGYRRENPSVPRAAKLRAAPAVPAVAPTPNPVFMASEPLIAPPPTSPLPTPQAAPYVAEASLPDGVTLQRATFRERLAAFALDVVVVLITAIALDLLEFRGGRNFVLLLLLYHVAFWAAKGTTIGGIICQLRLVRADGQPLQLGDAFIRGLAGILSGVVAGLGFLWMLKAPERETWHDKIAGTMVVKVPRHLQAEPPWTRHAT